MTSIKEARAESIQTIHEQITRGSAGEFTIDLLSTITPTLSCWVKNNIGRESTERGVVGRDQNEDVEIEIDGFAEGFIFRTIKRLSGQYGLSFSVLSEHNNCKIKTAGGKDLTLVLDPFENSDEYKHRLPTPPFTHFQIYFKRGERDELYRPIAAGAANLANDQMYLAVNGSNYYFHPGLKKLLKMPTPREVKSITDGNVVIASYDGKFKYSVLFDEYFTGLKKDLGQNAGSFHGKGGSHSYIDLANGAISAYVMFHEPRGEIDPAFLFALQANCKVVSVNLETGQYEDYQFDPGLQHERVPFLIAARSKELIREIIDYYEKAKRGNTNQTVPTSKKAS